MFLYFSDPISTSEEELLTAFDIEAWNYEWTKRYGSLQYDIETGADGTTKLDVEGVVLSPDRRAVWLNIPEMSPAMQMHVKWRLAFEGYGERDSFIHMTVHSLHQDSGQTYVD